MDTRSNLIGLMQRLRDGHMSVEDFAPAYEYAWNFELQRDDVSADEATVFERVFDTVAWYTPVVHDREAYPGFKSEPAVREAVLQALAQLAEQRGEQDRGRDPGR